MMMTPPHSQLAEKSQMVPASSKAASSRPSADQELDKMFTCSPQTTDKDSNVCLMFHIIYRLFL